jgi:hypothetical protein
MWARVARFESDPGNVDAAIDRGGTRAPPFERVG